jgi:alpha-beta hydrolase superfamily lysophospholipase
MARDVAVVILNPWGLEGIASQRALRVLAERSSAAGFATLRFDYLGTGDSSGSDSDPDRLGAWIESAELAIEEVQRLSGCAQVALVGLHLGATLAVRVAAECTNIPSLVIWAPYVKGRAYVREAKAYRALNDPGDQFPRAEEQGGIEAAGFLLSAETLAQLSALDLLADKRVPARRALLLGRDSVGSELPLQKHLQALGVEVTHAVGTGYKDLMQEPRKSVIPEADFQNILGFLEQHHPLDRQNMRVAGSSSSSFDVGLSDGESVRETACYFGPDQRLFGIISEPIDGAGQHSHFAVFLTTAHHHRTGPNGMYVAIARELARRGFPSLRFDLTAIGDSLVAPDRAETHLYSRAYLADITAALDFLQASRGARRFSVLGLCSGAYLAFHASLEDPRIIDAVMVNAQSFKWKEGDSLDVLSRNSTQGARFYKQAALDPKVWQRLFRGEVNVSRIARGLFSRVKERADVEVRRAMSSLGLGTDDGFVDVADGFQSLAAKGTRVYLVYSGHDLGLDYLEAQVGSRLRRFQRQPLFEMDVIEGPDHTFVQLWAQTKLRQMIAHHFERHFGERNAPLSWPPRALASDAR